ncbi:MAG: hypothetical protein KDI30_03480 [Pseudomonadales bacterium]|nr:hypothetical protein [Pseudomonadales bacterium]
MFSDIKLFRKFDYVPFWSCSPYEKCSFRCVYCNMEAQGSSKPIYNKNEIVYRLERELEFLYQNSPEFRRRKRIVIGGHADAYPDIESSLLITRELIEGLIACTSSFLVEFF